MIFRQLFDRESSTYTYLLADDNSRAAVMVDPVIEQVPLYLQLLRELDVKLVLSVETHTHADHVTGSGALRDATGCATRVGEQSKATCASGVFRDGEVMTVGDIRLQALYTPGHTNDSYSFRLLDDQHPAVFTGDTLLVRGCGRTDFQGGSAAQQHDSLMALLALPGHTIVYPGHDYKGWLLSTIAEEQRHNPRLLLGDKEAFVAHMNSLKLDNPRMMDIAVPANQQCGKAV